MVVFGGYNYGEEDAAARLFVNSLKNDIWIFDFTAGDQIINNITSYTTGVWTIGTVESGPQPAPRMFHTASYIITPDNSTEVMIISGGIITATYSGTASTVYYSCGVEDVWSFDFATHKWTELVPHTGQCNSGVVVQSGLLMCFVLLLMLLL